MSEDKNTNFLKWYVKKDFTLLEKMKLEAHREYYCRSAWFARDDEIEKLQSQLTQKDKIIKLLEEAYLCTLKKYNWEDDYSYYTLKKLAELKGEEQSDD